MFNQHSLGFMRHQETRIFPCSLLKTWSSSSHHLLRNRFYRSYLPFCLLKKHRKSLGKSYIVSRIIWGNPQNLLILTLHFKKRTIVTWQMSGLFYYHFSDSKRYLARLHNTILEYKHIIVRAYILYMWYKKYICIIKCLFKISGQFPPFWHIGRTESMADDWKAFFPGHS